MIVKLFNTGIYGTNCYILSYDSKESVIIDPGGDAEILQKYINDSKLNIKYILLTHGHFDHIGAVKELKQSTNAKVCIHKDDVKMIQNPTLNLSCHFKDNIILDPPDIILENGQKISLGDKKLKIIHTPGHTPGGISILTDQLLFTGDTLFAGSIGRTDFPNGDYDALIRSIKNNICILDTNLKILPGHGPESSLGTEIKSNPFLK